MAADRGGVNQIGEITGLTYLRFERVRDGVGDCSLVVTGPDDKCCELLGSLRTIRHELVLYREGRRVWEGPITRLSYQPGRVEIEGRDIGWYLSRRALEVDLDYTGQSVSAVKVLGDVLEAHYPRAGDPFNIGQFITLVEGPDDARTAAKYLAFTRTVGNLLDQYSSRGGIDYTVSGRRLVIYDAQTRVGVLPKMSDEWLSSSVNVTEYGQELKTRSFISNSETTYTSALAPQEWLNYYGPIDSIENNTDEGDGTPDNEDLQALQEVATRLLAVGFPTPVRLWVADGARLDPCYPAEFDELQAGAWVPVESRNTCRQLSQWQKLQKVSVTWTGGDELVDVSLTKAPSYYVDPS
jgi:NADH:ubiquinone oxidoreductase subunit